MIDLNDSSTFKHLDPKNVLRSTELFLDQGIQVLEDFKDFTLPAEYSEVENIVFSGMGGSALGAQIVYHLYKNTLSLPFYVNNDYTLPNFANENTLVILSSYSGTTEEILASAQDALKRGCKVTALTTSGALAEVMSKNNKPFIQFDLRNNPSNQPRLGSGYTILGTLIILSASGLLKLDPSEVLEDIYAAKNNFDNSRSNAIEIAKNIVGYVPVIVASEFLNGCSHVMRNQINECSKSLAFNFPIPELNHHLMEGLKNPQDKKLKFIFIESNLYSEKNTKRMNITKDVVNKNKILYVSYAPRSTSNISQALETVSFGGLLSFYLAILYGIDPSPIPWVDYFKEKLKS